MTNSDLHRSADITVVNGLGWLETSVDRGDGSSEFSGFEAETPFGTFYLIEIHGDAFTVEYDLTKIGEADTPDEAKRIGQRDFERRIGMALIPDVAQPTKLWPDIKEIHDVIAGHLERNGLTHSCLRQAAEDVQKLYAAAQPPDPIESLTPVRTPSTGEGTPR